MRVFRTCLGIVAGVGMAATIGCGDVGGEEVALQAGKGDMAQVTHCSCFCIVGYSSQLLDSAPPPGPDRFVMTSTSGTHGSLSWDFSEPTGSQQECRDMDGVVCKGFREFSGVWVETRGNLWACRLVAQPLPPAPVEEAPTVDQDPAD